MKFIQIAEHGGAFGELTARTAEKKYRCIYLDKHGARLCGGDEPDFMIISHERYVPVENSDGAVLIIAENADKLEIPAYMDGTVIISGEEDIPPCLEYAGAVISCGYGDKCTLSLSQRTDDKCMLSLQREIVTAFGKIVEPREIIVPLAGELTLEKAMLLAAVEIYLETGITEVQRYVKAYGTSI